MTINEFASQIGVSTATVSRAIHGRGRISEKTRQMVLARMKELGFTPNFHAQRLVTGRSQMVALDFLGEKQILADMFFVTLAQAIQQALHATGYGLLLNLMDDSTQSLLQLRRWIKSRAVDGTILVAGAKVDRSLLCELASARTPCVVIAQQTVKGIPFVGSVALELSHGARQVAQLLVDKGHRRIGFIGAEVLDVVYDAFREELERLGCLLSDQFVLTAGRTAQDGARAMAQMLTHPVRPTAVFARTDTLALGALQAAKDVGLKVPADLSLVGHDDIPAVGWCDPPLTTVRVHCAEMGLAATETLLSLLQSNLLPPPPRHVPSTLVLRQSVVTVK
jgi:DNA-binding LacI/PurR family transcriptional regulator